MGHYGVRMHGSLAVALAVLALASQTPGAPSGAPGMATPRNGSGERRLAAPRVRATGATGATGMTTAASVPSAAVTTASLPLPDGRSLTPTGQLVSAGDFPAAALLTPAGMLYVSDAGETPNLLGAFNTATLAATFTLPVTPPSSSHAPYAQSGSLTLSPDGRTLYVGGGATGTISAFSATVAPAQTATYTFGGYVGGIAASLDGTHLFASEPFDNNKPYGKGAMLVRLDMRDGSTRAATVGRHPLALTEGVLPRGRGAGQEVVAVANRDDGTVTVLDAATLTPVATVATGRQPAALLFVDNGTHLLVVDSLDDELVDVSTASWQISDRVLLSAPTGLGAAPSALAVSPDGHRVYVALSDDNAVAVVDRIVAGARRFAGRLRVIGRIPTAWYPTAVALDVRSGTLLVTSGKGIGQAQGFPPGVPIMTTVSAYNPGSSGLGVSGAVERIALPTSQDGLDALSAQVAADNGWGTAPRGTNSLPSAIKHVVYIIRENKTYDEEFGDEPGGAPENLLYGRPVTPNTHALADRYALLQAYYADEEVSDTGHQAAMGAEANDWVERFTQQSYGLDGAPRPGSELGNGDDILWAPSDYLFDAALVRGITFRDYGEFYRQDQSRNGPAVTPALDAHIVHDFPGFGFNLGVKDTTRVAFWKNQFDRDVAKGTFPALEVVYLPEDHTTEGLNSGLPQQQVADSDLATGQLVEALSRSPYWTSTAVFLSEDDPQSGVDHVDEHRTLGLVVSPWVKPATVSTRHYDQFGMLRTIEELLGLSPLTEFDATARPMDDLFGATPDATPYTAITPIVSLPSPAARQALRRMARATLGAHPRLDSISPADQRDLEWFAVRGTPYHGTRARKPQHDSGGR